MGLQMMSIAIVLSESDRKSQELPAKPARYSAPMGNLQEDKI